MEASNSLACFHFGFASAELRSGGLEQPGGGKGSRKEGGRGGTIEGERGGGSEVRGVKEKCGRGEEKEWVGVSSKGNVRGKKGCETAERME